MLEFSESEFEGGVGGDILMEMSERAKRAVTLMRDRRKGSIEDTGGREARLLSIREIAELVGRSPATVSKYLAGENVEPAPGKVYGYSLPDYVNTRLGLKRTPMPLGSPVYVAVANFKGGVSKSTMTAHLAWAFGLLGYRTKVVDLDPQGTVSSFFGLNPDYGDADHTILPYLAGERDSLDYAVVKSEVETLKVIPSNLSLNEADMLLPGRQAKTNIREWFFGDLLRTGLDSLTDGTDVVFIDCPPSLSYLTTIGVRAADLVLVPMRPSMPDLASSVSFLEMFGAQMSDWDTVLKETRGLPAKRYGSMKLVITQGRRRGGEERPALEHIEDFEGAIRGIYGPMVANRTFPHMAAIENASANMRTIYDVSSDDVVRRSQVAARDVVDELVGEVQALVDRTAMWKGKTFEEVSHA